MSPEAVGTASGPGPSSKSKTPTLTPEFEVRIDVNQKYPGEIDYQKADAKRYDIEIKAIDDVMKRSDPDLAKFVRAQLQAQRDVCEAKQKLAKAEGMKIGDVFADLDNDVEGDDEGD